jgi:glucokinase
MQHSFDKVNSVTQNMVLNFDTNAGIYTNSSIMQRIVTAKEH